MIRLLDRYVAGTFLLSAMVFTLALGPLFLAVDFATKLGRFLQLKTLSPLPFIFRYYLVRLPMVISYLLPAVVLFATIFTVTRLARSNEILPIAASGISLRRMSAPFLVAAVVAVLGMAANDEFVLPRLGDSIQETDEILSARETSYGVEDYDGWTKLFAHEYDHVRRVLYSVLITRLDPQARPREHIRARLCRWDPVRRRWVAHDGIVEYPEEFITSPGSRPEVRKEPIGPDGYVVEAPFTPETLRKGSTLMNLMTFSPLRRLLEEARRFPHIPACALKVHARLSFPLSPVILVLLGLPLVVQAHSRSFVRDLFFCFLVALAFYLIHFTSMMLGYQGKVSPAVAAWFSPAVFGTAGMAAFGQMRT